MATGRCACSKQARRRAATALLCLALGALASSSPVTAPRSLRPALWPAPAGLQVGDWVFRSGTAGDSHWIQRLSHSAYSHMAVVAQTSPRVLLVHATTDDDPTRRDQVILSDWDSFASADLSAALAVARPRFLSAAQRAASARHAAARVGQPFALRARGDTPLYCTTLVLDAVRSQAPHFNPAWQTLDVPTLRGQYLFPRALAQADVQWLAASPDAPPPTGGP